MGQLICHLSDLETTGAKGVTIAQGATLRDIVVVRDGLAIRAYENSCPHLKMPLETMPDRFLDATGTHLVCTTHGARFRVGDGTCVSGPCQGDRLRTIGIAVVDQEVYLG